LRYPDEASVSHRSIDEIVSPRERNRRLAATADGAYRLLYVAPERLAQPGFIEQLRRARWQTMVVDEAHCVSTWGRDFRPAYRQLPAACQRLGIEQICAFTATATRQIRQGSVLRCLQCNSRSPARSPEL
jgi:ATP-dependent DNA helicase RecQ